MLKAPAFFYGLWIGLLVTVSAILELYFEGQIVIERTVVVVLILGTSGIFSGAISWVLYSRSTFAAILKYLYLGLLNLVLYCICGAILSYLILEFPDMIVHIYEDGIGSYIPIEIFGGFLGSSFSFRTFGLPLVWPFGAISGAIGTVIFIYINNRLKSRHSH